MCTWSEYSTCNLIHFEFLQNFTSVWLLNDKNSKWTLDELIRSIRDPVSPPRSTWRFRSGSGPHQEIQLPKNPNTTDLNGSRFFLSALSWSQIWLLRGAELTFPAGSEETITGSQRVLGWGGTIVLIVTSNELIMTSFFLFKLKRFYSRSPNSWTKPERKI